MDIILYSLAMVVLFVGGILNLIIFAPNPEIGAYIIGWTILYGALTAASEHYRTKKKYCNWRW